MLNAENVQISEMPTTVMPSLPNQAITNTLLQFVTSYVENLKKNCFSIVPDSQTWKRDTISFEASLPQGTRNILFRIIKRARVYVVTIFDGDNRSTRLIPYA